MLGFLLLRHFLYNHEGQHLWYHSSLGLDKSSGHVVHRLTPAEYSYTQHILMSDAVKNGLHYHLLFELFQPTYGNDALLVPDNEHDPPHCNLCKNYVPTQARIF